MSKLHDGLCFVFTILFLPAQFVRSAIQISWKAAELIADKAAR